VGSPAAESTRFPGEGQSAQGQSGPKARPKGVADGQRVNIPAPGMEVEPRVTQLREGSGKKKRIKMSKIKKKLNEKNKEKDKKKDKKKS